MGLLFVRKASFDAELLGLLGLIVSSFGPAGTSTCHRPFRDGHPSASPRGTTVTTEVITSASTCENFGGTPRESDGICGTAGFPPALRWGCMPLFGLLGDVVELLGVTDVDEPTCQLPLVGVGKAFV